MMRLLFTCGGTAGHINPAISVANLFRSRKKDIQILFVGAEGGMETNLVPREGYEIKTVNVHSLRHSSKPTDIVYNLKTVCGMAATLRDARKIVKSFKPDAVIGTGGYASFPAVYAASRMKIPTLIHESNAMPGITTKNLAKRADKIMVGVEGTEQLYAFPEKVVVTGTPVREEFLFTEQNRAKRDLGLDHRPVVASFFGSLGARDMNKAMAEFIVELCKNDEFQLVHACGKQGWSWMPKLVEDNGIVIEEHPNVRLLEYIYDMPNIMAAADLLVCRAGASTLSEITVASKPAILIPSPNVAANHQEVNARKLAESGGVEVIPESEINGKKLYSVSRNLLSNLTKLDTMSRNLRAVAIPDAGERIYKLIEETIRK